MTEERPSRRRRRRRRSPSASAATPPDTSTASTEPTEDGDGDASGDAQRDTAAASQGERTLPVRVRRVSPEDRARRQAERRARQAAEPAGPSKMRYVLLLLVGVLVGRIVQANFDPSGTAMSAVDIIVYGGIAFSVAFLWRRWARRAVLQRRLDQQKRASKRREG